MLESSSLEIALLSKKVLVEEVIKQREQLEELEKLVPGRSSSSKSVLLMSDLHIGDTMAPMSDKAYRTDTGAFIGQNTWNKAGYDHLLNIKDHLQREVPTLLHINGEPFNGDNRKSLGAGCWSPNIGDQMTEAERLIRTFRFDNITGCKGSGYHSRKDATDFEDMFYRKLNAVAYNGMLHDEIKKRNTAYLTKQWDGQPVTEKASDWNGPIIDNYILFSIHGRVFSCSHHVATNRNFAYKTTSIAREMAAMEFESGKHYEVEDKPTIIIRSHTHYHVFAGYHHTLGMITPSWKFADDYAYRSGVGGVSPTIGAIEFVIESNGKYHFNPLLLEQKEYPKAPVLVF